MSGSRRCCEKTKIVEEFEEKKRREREKREREKIVEEREFELTFYGLELLL